jgi:chemotaxis protein MotB
MGKARRKEEGINTNAWITTYTDLMTLLLTFFVLLISLSTIDNDRKREALNSLIGAFGFKPGAMSVMGPEKGMNITLGTAPMVKEEIDLARLQNIAFKNGLDADVRIMRQKERIIISLENRVLFERGSSGIKGNARPFLMAVAGVLKGAPGLIEFRGFVDQAETIFDPDPLKKGMYLSTQRAMAVYTLFEEEAKVPWRKMVAHGLGIQNGEEEISGEQKPKGRQVEIICNYGSEVPSHLRYKPRNRDIILDIKGFLFKLGGGESG